MITIKIGHNQDPNRAIQKLKNKLIQEGLFQELKRRRYYAKPSLKKRLKREEAERQRVKDYRKRLARAKQEEDNIYYKRH
jgi:small subunit ribosomal protein S21